MTIIFTLITISGIFGSRDEDLDILPPPPPFPKIGSKTEEAKAAEKATKEKVKKREYAERIRLQEEKRKLTQRKQKKIKKEKAVGKIWEVPIKAEKKKLSIKEQFAGLFPAISFGKKEKRMEISEELQELPLPKKKGKAQKPMALEAETPEFMPREVKEKKVTGKDPDFLLKESEMASMPSNAKDEEEIQKAIESLRKPKRKPLLSRIFAKKEKMPKAQMTEAAYSFDESKVEMPHVMPRTYDKIDHVEIVEAKIHKARMALMEFNFEEAKRIYVEIMKAYNNMEPKEKQEVYEDIGDLYYERKSAERFANK
ncbi:MAG: hypothetical protein AABX34_05790 [Nanoarchaeota archaeon]